MTTTLGACFHDEFKDTIKKSIELLSANQSKYGHIPNCVGSYNNDRQSDVTFNSIDAPLWYIIGHYIYASSYKDKSLITKYKNNIDKALFWLKCQDPDDIGLIAQQPTADWQDAFPHKYGYTIHCNSLYYAALKFMGENKEAENLKKIINGEYRAYSSLYSRELGYYFPWGWKNHDTIREHEIWFDTGGNLLAIITGLATPAIAKNILNYIEKNKINKPYPCKVTWPPLKKGDKEWHSYFELCNAKEPYQYLNAGIWPFIGGLYVVALIKTGQIVKAEKELENLAKANMQIIQNPDFPQYMYEISENKHIPMDELLKTRKKEFNEWLDGRTGEPKGEPYQAWSAGTYLYAFECLKQKKVLFFN
jgi:glycogen debranching enzyme